jgi:geranylgeranyl pyrophosphate synthase
MSWEETLDHYGVLIEKRLRDYFAQVLREARAYHLFIEKVYSGLEEFAFRKGKRLASCSTLLTYSGYTGLVDDRILGVAVGIEVYRHCILIHDDLVDRDDLRRGEKTVHKMFGEGRAERFGEGVAVFLGDMAYTLATRAILDSGFEEDKLTEVLRILSKGYRDVNESQILDLLFEDEEVNVDEWYIMASKRAASLFKVTMLAGAVLADAPERDLRLLEKAAVNIGYAFDIQDDIIDTYASEDQYGRPPCRDLTLSKKPLHVICALRSKNQENSEALRKLLGKKLDPEEIELARLAIEDSGGLEKSKEISKKHAETAKELVLKTMLNEETKRFFKSLINYIEESLEWYK